MSRAAASADSVDDALQARVRTIRDVLRADLTIPEYQRPYKWSEKNVGQLIDDIRAFMPTKAYRIGTIIRHGNDIVDGQQRYISFVLISLHLQKAHPELDHPTPRAAPRVSKNGIDISRENLRRNHEYISDTLGGLTDKERAAFAEFFYDKCDVVELGLGSLDEAFQMFDSQNTRGRALFPTDLLKAFHIREMTSSLVPRSLVLDMVRKWQELPPKTVNALFSDYLFKIKRWANGHDVPATGFGTDHIHLFKGIRQSQPNAENHWAMPFLYAKNFTDDFRQENNTLVRYGALKPVDYPFQIDQPIINGETFFMMVAHYHAVAVSCGLLPSRDEDGPRPKDDLASPLVSAVGIWDAHRPDSRLHYVRNLFDCLLLYYVDRFGSQELARAGEVISRYAAALRLFHTQLRRTSVNSYALGLHPVSTVNVFRELRESQSAMTFLRRSIPRPHTQTEKYPNMAGFWGADE